MPSHSVMEGTKGKIEQQRAESFGVDVLPAAVENHHQPRVGLIDVELKPRLPGRIVVLRDRVVAPRRLLSVQQRLERKAFENMWLGIAAEILEKRGRQINPFDE